MAWAIAAPPDKLGERLLRRSRGSRLRIYYLCEGLFLAGGQMVNLDHVLTLRRLGYDARFWILRTNEPIAGFRPQFPPGREAPWQLDPPELTADDVVVVGEMFGTGALAVRETPARKVVHNQGYFLTFQSFIDLPSFKAWGCEAMICPSFHAAAQLRRMGWDRPVHVVRPALDPVFAPNPAQPRRLQIAAVTSKRAAELRLVRGILRSLRPDLAGVPWVGISGVPRSEVARRMQEAQIFVALGEREGLGLPPLEAMATGALVAGFHAGGGLEYARPENGDWFDDLQHIELAQALISLLDGLRGGEDFAARRAAGIATAAQFSRPAFDAQLAQAWAAIAAAG
jgi:hypothetical protein